MIGNERAKWRGNISTYKEVIEHDVWPGIDVAWHGSGSDLEADFIVAPDADPKAISLNFDLQHSSSLDADGNLSIHLGEVELKLLKPNIYQQVAHKRRHVDGHFALRTRRDSRELLVEVSNYDRSKPLVIDPTITLNYSTYLGGSGGTVVPEGDSGSKIAVDSSGSAYVTGYSYSPDFPLSNAFQNINHGQPTVFLTKFSPDGRSLIYSTYLGGSFGDYGSDIAVDSNQNAYVTGLTYRQIFPFRTPFKVLTELRGELEWGEVSMAPTPSLQSSVQTAARSFTQVILEAAHKR